MPAKQPRPAKPIASQAEADQVREKLATEVANVRNIPIDEAYRRIDGLFKSGLLAGGDPDDPGTQLAIDAFLSVHSSTYAHLK